MEIVILFALILLNGAFAMSEIALVTARKTRLQRLIDEGSSSAIAAVTLGANPTRFLSTIQIGITSISVMNGIVGEAALAPPLTKWLMTMGMQDPYAAYAGTGLVVVLITYFSIVLGELVPKRLGQSNPEAVAMLVAKPIGWLAIATMPFVRLLSGSTNGLLRLLGVKERAGSQVTEDEIHAVLAEGTSAGVIESHEHTMVRNVFLLDDRVIGSLMVPQGDVMVLDINQPLEENLRRIDSSHHERFPVVDGSMKKILGIVNAKEVLLQIVRGGPADFTHNMQPPLYVPETLTGMELLENFRNSNVYMACVVDEYGEVQGIVTLKDLIEAITGEFHPRNPETSWAVQREDGSWLLDGHIPVPELKDRLGLSSVPEEELGRYHTLSGMIMRLTGRIPKEADTIEWQDWKFEILDMDGKTIDKVLAIKLPTAADLIES